jgi:hypothetical protein
MIFEIVSDRFFSQRWAALKEVSAVLAAAVGNGALDCQHHTPVLRAWRPLLTAELMAWIIIIIVTSVSGRQSNLRAPG